MFSVGGRVPHLMPSFTTMPERTPFQYQLESTISLTQGFHIVRSCWFHTGAFATILQNGDRKIQGECFYITYFNHLNCPPGQQTRANYSIFAMHLPVMSLSGPLEL